MQQIFRAFTVAAAALLVVQSALAESEPNGQSEPIPNDTDSSDASKQTPSELWVRLVGVDIGKDSPLRKDKSVSTPPTIYAIIKKNGETIKRSSTQTGWSVVFPRDLDHETIIRADNAVKYTVDVWDSQWGRDKLLFTIGPFEGPRCRDELIDPTTNRFDEKRIVTFKAEDEHATISVAYAGTRIWYRLVNVTIPPDSPHRKDSNLNHPPRLEVTLQSDGVRYGGTTTRQRGWSADFAKITEHCWAVREGIQRRYTVEVWDNQRLGWQLIFSVAGLSAEDFGEVITENVGAMVETDRASTVTFERIEQPF